METKPWLSAKPVRLSRAGDSGLKAFTFAVTGGPAFPEMVIAAEEVPFGAMLQSTLIQIRFSFATVPWSSLTFSQGWLEVRVNSNGAEPRLKMSRKVRCWLNTSIVGRTGVGRSGSGDAAGHERVEPSIATAVLGVGGSWSSLTSGM